jgi:hypothetical protein
MDDLSARRILITEDEDDLDLDKLLLGDASGAAAARESFTSTTPPPSPKSLSPSSLSSSTKHHASTSSSAAGAAAMPQSHVAVVGHHSLSLQTTACHPIILASEDGGDGPGQWILPPPALPGDYLNSSLHRVPSKSILKKTSSYGNFDSVMSSSRGGGSSSRTRRLSIAMDSSSTSQASRSRGCHNRFQVANEPPSLLSGDASPKISKKESCISFASLDSSQSQQQLQRCESIGWDLDADDALSASPLRNIIALAEEESVVAGSSESRNSDSSTRMRRNVSFHAVDVREYDRTVGDHPGCRSGPPVSTPYSFYSFGFCLLYSDFLVSQTSPFYALVGIELLVHISSHWIGATLRSTKRIWMSSNSNATLTE